MKATDLLKEQHQELDMLFAQLEQKDDAYDRKTAREAIALKLVAHTTIERELFYPELERSDSIAEAYEEHAVIEWCLQRLLVADTREESFRAKVTVLKDLVTHHVEEEEDVILPEAERWLDYDRLNDLGQMMQRRFESIEERGYETLLAEAIGVPRGQLRKAHPTASKRATKKRAAAKTSPAKRATTKRATKKRAPAKRATPTARATTKRAPAKKATTKRATTARRAPAAKRPTKTAAKKTTKRVTRRQKST